MDNNTVNGEGRQKLVSSGFLMAFILISSLFFLWGIAHGMLDTLNKHFQNMLNLSKAQSGMIQFSVYTAYFGMALPAGFFLLVHFLLLPPQHLNLSGFFLSVYL
jgi:fucose permease